MDHDFITSHVRRFDQEPYYVWWNSLHHPSSVIERTRYLRSFNAIYRVSNRALRYIHEAYLSGWSGHHEVLLSTILHSNEFSLLDFGGKGDFVQPRDKNRFYTSCSLSTGGLKTFGTILYRPVRACEGKRKNTLYHPVKDRSSVEGPLRKIFIAIEEWYSALVFPIKRSMFFRANYRTALSAVWRFVMGR